MYLNSKQLKGPAWESMRAAVPSAVRVTLAYFLLTSGLGAVVDLFAPSVTLADLFYGSGLRVWGGLFLAVLLAIYNSVMSFGYTGWALNTARRRETGYGDLFNGFSVVGQVIWMELQIVLRAVGWSLLLAIGFSVLIGLAAFMFMAIRPLAYLGTALVTAALYAAIFGVLLRYELAPYLLWDYPDDGAGAAVRRSVQMMRGNIWRLFKLYLSFWPWILGSILLSWLAMGAVLSFHIGELTDLFQTFSSGGINPAAAVAQIQTMLNGPAATLLLLAVGLPIDLFYHPYQRITVGNFYRMLSQEAVAEQFTGETF